MNILPEREREKEYYKEKWLQNYPVVKKRSVND